MLVAFRFDVPIGLPQDVYKRQVSLSDLSGEWVIELVNGKKIVGTAEVTPFNGFNLDKSRIYGNVGCNTINGCLLYTSNH